MFTGLIEAVGEIERVTRGANGGATLGVSAPFGSELALGESVAVNGVCLTVVTREPKRFSAELSPATLRATSLGNLAVGSRVNLERAVRADARLGGHFVLGHVDITSTILKWESHGDHWWLEIALPQAIDKWVVDKGSIAVDGISLTIAQLNADSLAIQIVPHTRANTNLLDRAPGDTVNLEADIIGKYAQRLHTLTSREGFA